MRTYAYILPAALAAALLLASGRYAWAAPGDVVMEAEYPGGDADFDVRVSDAALMPDGGAVLTGTVAYDNGNRDMLTVRFTREGGLVWALAFDETMHDTSSAVCADDDGNVTVAGAVLDLENPKDDYLGSYHTDYRVIRYSPKGELVFEADGSGYDSSNVPVDVVPAPDGGAFVTGRATNPQETFDFVYTVRYGPDGGLLYETFEDFGVETHPAGVAYTREGWLYIAAHVYDEFLEHFDVRLVRYDPADGLFDMQNRHTDEYFDQRTSDVTADLAGNVVIVGETEADGGRALTLKYSPSGKLLWEHRYDRTENPTHADAVATDSAGRIYVAGSSKLPFGRTDILLYVLSPEGGLIGERVYEYDEECDPVAVFVGHDFGVSIALTVISEDKPGSARLIRAEGWPLDRARLTGREAAGLGADIRLHGGLMPFYPALYTRVEFAPEQPRDGYHFDLDSAMPEIRAVPGGVVPLRISGMPLIIETGE